MTLQFTNNEGHAIITLCGRLDTSCAMQTQAEINQFLSAQGPRARTQTSTAYPSVFFTRK